MRIFTSLLLALTLLNLPTELLHAKETVGYIEKVRIYPGELLIKAKIDTGAKTSSLNCNCVTPIKHDSEEWVRFSLTNEKGEIKWFERKIERITKIKRHFGESQVRYVVKLGICLGNTYKETDVTLVDRTGFNYQVLIGRRFLDGSHIIDPELTFLTKPRCKDVPHSD